MVIIAGLLMEVVTIVIQHPLNPICPVVEDKFQSGPLNFTIFARLSCVRVTVYEVYEFVFRGLLYQF
jgi:hypothetical protein